MNAQRVTRETAPLRLAVEPGPATERDAIGAWLGTLDKLLRVPAREAALIREELESHLRERVRDLSVGGMSEDEAVRSAVAELGDAAALAARYRQARSYPRRRLMMNLTMLAVAGAGVAVGVVALSQPGSGTHVSVFAPPEQSAAEQKAIAKTFNVDIHDVALKDALHFLAQSSGLRLAVAWRPIEEGGIAADTPVTIIDAKGTVETVLRALGEDLAPSGAGDNRLDFRVVEGTLSVATTNWFDRKETVLACYDLSSLSGDVETEAVTQLIENFAYPSGWVDNGGDLARLALVGPRMFVEAPRRYQSRIEWFLGELRDKQEGAAGPALRDARMMAEKLAAANQDVALDRRAKALADDNEAVQRQLRDYRSAAENETTEARKAAIDAGFRVENLATQNAELQKVAQDLRDQLQSVRLTAEKLANDREVKTNDLAMQNAALAQTIKSLEARVADLQAAQKQSQDSRPR